MKLSHQILNRSRIEEVLQKCVGMGGTTFDTYMDEMGKIYDSKSNLTYYEFIDFCFEVFVEAYMKYFGKNYGIFDVNYVPSQSRISFSGKDINGKSSTILSLHIIKDRDITMNRDHLSSFTNISRTGYMVDVNSTSNMFVVSTAPSVNKTILETAPTFKNKVKFILGGEIRKNVDNNPDFWYTFALAVFEHKVVIPDFTGYVLRDFQNDGVYCMMNNTIGKVLLPTGTGKSVIQADFIRRFINEIKPCPVILILSPRIVLSYQLLNVVFNHLTHNGIDAQYCNLSSGDMEEVSQKMYELMKAKNLVPKTIVTTTNIEKIKEIYENSKLNNFPLIISATYHSGWLMGTIDKEIDVVLYDEAHNLVMGRMEEDFKVKSLALKSDRKFFFTATPCNTESDEGRGMNNPKLFGEEIFRKSYREMVDRNEILPVKLHTIRVNDYIILKNKEEEYSIENTKSADFDRDNTVRARSISEAFYFHEMEIKKTSAHPESIAPKMLITCDGVASLKGILKSKEIQKLQSEGVNILAISTEVKYYKNGEEFSSYDFKERFMNDVRLLKAEDKAIILHIDMIGEGLDVTGITGVMAFTKLGILKLIQLLGRSMRLHDIDRKNLYDGKFYKGMNREKMMVKPYTYMIVPMFLSDSNDLHQNTKEIIMKIHEAYDFLPEMIYNDSRIIGANEDMTNKDFKSFNHTYEMLDFKQEIELDNFFKIMGSWKPDINL